MKKILFVLFSLCLAAAPAWAADKIRIAATTSTFAAIAGEIAGDQADLYYVASPNQNIHFISPTPKDILKIKRAEIFIHGGLDLEAWRAPLLDAVGRTDFLGPDAPKAIDVSKGIELKEIPGSLSRAQGDIHAYGNPHYWLDPVNAKIIAKNITEGLSRNFPDRAALFQSRLEAFDKKIDEKMKDWQARLAPYQGENVVVYHNSWVYFTARFHLTEAAFLEPKPGIPPSPKHLQEVIQTMKERKVKAVIKEIFQESRTPKNAAQAAGAEVVTLLSEAGQAHGDYAAMIEENIKKLEGVFKKDVTR